MHSELTFLAALVIVGGGMIGFGGGIALCKKLKSRWFIMIVCLLGGLFLSKWAMEKLLVSFYSGSKEVPILVAADGWLMAAFAVLLIFVLWQGNVRKKEEQDEKARLRQ